jgi:hypothetical protein
MEPLGDSERVQRRNVKNFCKKGKPKRKNLTSLFISSFFLAIVIGSTTRQQTTRKQTSPHQHYY